MKDTNILIVRMKRINTNNFKQYALVIVSIISIN